MKYKVLCHELRHNGKIYKAGDEIDMPESKQHEELGSVAPVKTEKKEPVKTEKKDET